MWALKKQDTKFTGIISLSADHLYCSTHYTADFRQSMQEQIKRQNENHQTTATVVWQMEKVFIAYNRLKSSNQCLKYKYKNIAHQFSTLTTNYQQCSHVCWTKDNSKSGNNINTRSLCSADIIKTQHIVSNAIIWITHCRYDYTKSTLYC